ncbi:hypothetical protein EDC19_2415 [Natranaerovirga hydrolytica]|uniref:Uncharacterized protein n=1 Tax=Natranaerovirga hydrolytica TaxID=680378 RepID=A0A4R1MDU9_9FIRM|nr:hypothetical protein [Natranaerovirga hydrolytica]TCK90646.1 hypothetical protein EDC19_2415 [Natranaerovirga hydrolytica]
MQAIAKAILKTIIVTVFILLFMNMVYFFPWYMTMITETFHISQLVANDNYLKQSYYDESLNRLRERPIFRERKYDIEIIVLNESGSRAVGYDDESLYEYSTDFSKPYRQRGSPITVEIKANYPLSLTLWGNRIEGIDIPASFSLTTFGLKHYKDLEYN